MSEFIEMEGFVMINLKNPKKINVKESLKYPEISDKLADDNDLSDNSEYSVHHVKKKIHKLDKKKLKNTLWMTFNLLKNIPMLPKNF